MIYICASCFLGNGDDGRRCRDAHIEGQTIEERLGVSPESWPHKIQDESGSIDPGFPRHNYANDLPPPPSWFPPFFFFNKSPLSCAQQQAVQRSGCSRPVLRIITWFNILPDLPIRALIFVPSAGNLFVLYSCAPSSQTPGTGSGTFLTGFPFRRSRRRGFAFGTWLWASSG